ncbi:hypothetical protein A9Q97_05880 [Rhodospirillales bacterium 47_12_T64]|nr:hypothetical protein A9Q97_05880 [Rhodospirillales bacterium 47_12_T64]
MIEFFTALAMVLVIEGILLSLFPHRLRQLLEMMTEIPHASLRVGGLACASFGVFFVWLLRVV